MSSSITLNNSQGGAGDTNFSLAAFGSMTIHNSTISDNVDDNSGGIYNSGVMIITNSTIANNRRGLFGGGGIQSNDILTIANSTISGNISITCAYIFVIFYIGTVILQYTILSVNSSRLPQFCRECFGPITSLGNNIIGDLNVCDINLLSSDLTGDPGLGAFVDDGMPGRGHFPLNPGSQAVDAGNNTSFPSIYLLCNHHIFPFDILSISFLYKYYLLLLEFVYHLHLEYTAKTFHLPIQHISFDLHILSHHIYYNTAIAFQLIIYLTLLLQLSPFLKKISITYTYT